MPSLMLAEERVRDNKLEVAIFEIIAAYNNKEDVLINQYIHPSHGIYYLLKINNTDFWLQRKMICLTNNCIGENNLIAPYSQKLLEQKVDIDSSILYEDDNLSDGIFVEEDNLHKLTNTIRRFGQTNKTQIDEKELKRIWRTENKSKKITVVKHREDSSRYEMFIFYLSYINNNWYLSIIDFNN